MRTGLLSLSTGRKAIPTGTVAGEFEFLLHQYFCGFDFSKFDPDLIPVFDFIIRRRDFDLATRLLKRQKRLTPSRNEPRDLFMLG